MGDALVETRNVLEARMYINKEGKECAIETPPTPEFFTGDEQFTPPKRIHQTTAHVVKADITETAVFLKAKKAVNPVVLIPVDPNKLGGGFVGCHSIEEQLFIRTNALLAMDVQRSFDTETLTRLSNDVKRRMKTFLLCVRRMEKEIGYNLGRNIERMLLEYAFAKECTNYHIPECGAIYLRDLQVFRDSKQKANYEFFEKPEKISFILCSSIPGPKYEKTGKGATLDAKDEKLLRKKLCTFFNIAFDKGHDAVVLTAFGCGFNRAPPECVAGIFRDLLTSTFTLCFKHTTFAILEDENCGKEWNPNGNLVPFQQEFLLVRTTKGSKKGCITM